jgi:hypothetical protein
MRFPVLAAFLMSAGCCVVLTLSTLVLAQAIETPGPIQTPEPAVKAISFNRDIRPILSEHCFNCHGMDEKNRKAGLRLDERGAALRGGKSDGPAIVPGKPNESALVKRITSHADDSLMPPPRVKNPLSAKQIDTLKQWIAGGAEYAKHWAFEAPRKEAVPQGEHPIDFFVKRKVADAKLQPSPPADAATLCRRLYLDLIGLPPTPQQLEAFLRAYRSNRARAIVELMRSLASSPQFGERWARLWLDIARFADSNGFEKDLLREMWAWRAWVIQAFNQDMPYDRFLIEQIAGDLLPEPTQDQIVATGLLRNSMINEEGAIVPEQFRMFEMFDRMDCVGKATLGLSLQCAQCHSHKFDPISQDEYYGLFAFLNNTYEAQSWVYTKEQRQQIGDIHSRVRAANDLVKKRRPQWQDEMAAWERSVLAKEATWRPLKAVELDSTGGLNHPTQETDLGILTQGHPTTSGDIFAVFLADWKDATGLRLEALTHPDMPFGGPGRSKYGTWAISEMKVLYQLPEGKTWQPLKLVNASADFAEPDGKVEPEWKADFDNAQKRTRGPVAYLIDGDENTGWRADRGPGLRNQDGVAVVQFAKPLDLPENTKLKVLLVMNHGGSDNGRHNMQLGCCRVSVTTSANPQAQPVDYAAILAMSTPPENRSEKQRDAIFSAWLKSLTDSESRKTHEAIAADWKKHPVGLTSVMHLAERSSRHPRPTHLLDRGEWDRPKHVVKPHVPALLHPLEKAAPTRLDFARWLASERNPLAARAQVNRVWQAIFGTGLVETAEDFGTRTPVPDYLDLLDWLAVDFMEHRWSHRHLIETIVTSETYAQSAAATPALIERDPKNRLLARGARFRMDAEVIRDTTLSIAGLLHLKETGGPSIFPPVPQSVLDYNFFKPTYWFPPEGPDRYRRALYVFRKRSMPDPVLTTFDAPNADVACARRPRSNTPLSALTSLNEITFVEAAQALALRILKEGGKDDDTRVHYAFRLCTARPAQFVELQEVRKLLALNRDRLRRGELQARPIAFSKFTKLEDLPVDATPNDVAAWTIVSRVLLNLDETLCRPCSRPAATRPVAEVVRLRTRPSVPMNPDHDYLRRLPDEYYRDQSYVHWSMTNERPQERLAHPDLLLQIPRDPDANDVSLWPVLSHLLLHARPHPPVVGRHFRRKRSTNCGQVLSKSAQSDLGKTRNDASGATVRSRAPRRRTGTLGVRERRRIHRPQSGTGSIDAARRVP